MTAYIVPTDLLLRKRKWTKYLQSLYTYTLIHIQGVRYNIKKNNKYQNTAYKDKRMKIQKSV